VDGSERFSSKIYFEVKVQRREESVNRERERERQTILRAIDYAQLSYKKNIK